MTTIRALQLLADREIALVERDAPPPPGARARCSFACAASG